MEVTSMKKLLAVYADKDLESILFRILVLGLTAYCSAGG
jgi:hypothetical protein